MSKASQVVVLGEDSRHQQFIRRYLRRLGYGTHAMRFANPPSGGGSAEQWVREHFAVEVQALRTRQAETKLILLIDADNRTVAERIRQLDQALHRAGVLPIDPSREEIARLVPKRNIETWILCLNQEQVDEETDYKRARNDWSDLIPAAIQVLYDWTRANAIVPEACIESLRVGIRELQNLTL